VFADERDHTALLTDTLFHKGWASALPPSAIDILEVIGDCRSPVLDEIDVRLRRWTRRSDGLDSPAWLTDEIWFQRDGLDLVDGSSAEDAAYASRRDDVDNAAQFASCLSSMGLPVQLTTGSVLRLLLACEVVIIGRWGDYSINPLAPAAADTLAF
jgi:hypothetical protein